MMCMHYMSLPEACIEKRLVCFAALYLMRVFWWDNTIKFGQYSQYWSPSILHGKVQDQWSC